MKAYYRSSLIALLLSALTGMSTYEPPPFPYAPAAGEQGSTAVAYDDGNILSWAGEIISIEYGLEVAEEWRNPEAALGPANTGETNFLVLGRGGVVVLGFSPAIGDSEGDDFAVFENSFSESFLELAFVEVSSDGQHFVRFPNYSQTGEPVPGFGVIQPEFIHGLAGKYAVGFGTPFDLGELAAAHSAVLAGYAGFSTAYSSQLLENFPFLDLQDIRFVRLIDIPGDGLLNDSEGFPIYDPYPTIITAGFDLDGVGVLNHGQIPKISFVEWSTLFDLSDDAEADDDKDGWSQYLEYQFSSDPTDATSFPVVESSISTSDGFTLLYWRNLSAEGTLGVQTSADGVAWFPFTGPAEELEIRNTGSVTIVLERIQMNLSSSSLLVRFSSAIPPAAN